MDVLQVLQNIGYKDLKDLGRAYQTRPLYRDSDNKTALCIDKTTGLWYDFVMRRGGKLQELVQMTLKLSSLDQAKEYIGGSSLGQFIQPTRAVQLQEIKKFNKDILLKLNKDHSYWINRGISKSTIETFEGGVASNGKMAFRYVFPMFDERNDLIGFSGRRLNDNEDFAKWMHFGAKTNWLYPLKWNAENIVEKKQVILIESIGDMLALWDIGIKNTLVTFGLSISPKIIQFLIKADVNKIFLSFNNDDNKNFAGNGAALDGKKQLMKFFDIQQIVIALPNVKDFGEMETEERKLWTSQNLI